VLIQYTLYAPVTPQPHIATGNRSAVCEQRSPTLTAAKFRMQNSHNCKLRRRLNQNLDAPQLLEHAAKASAASLCIALSPARSHDAQGIARSDCCCSRAKAAAPATPCTRCTLPSASHHASVREDPHFLIRLHDSSAPPKNSQDALAHRVSFCASSGISSPA
jgi:hypothetical protein